jgi:hypothetical protein
VGFFFIIIIFILWANWVLLVYTTCIIRSVLRFFNEIFLLIKNKNKKI